MIERHASETLPCEKEVQAVNGKMSKPLSQVEYFGNSKFSKCVGKREAICNEN